MAGNIQVVGTITGTNASKTINATVTSAAVGMGVTELVLQSGDNTITIPANSLGCVISMPAGNTQATKLKGVGGDTGLTISKVGVTVLNWDSGSVPSNFVINSAGLQTGLYTQISFF